MTGMTGMTGKTDIYNKKIINKIFYIWSYKKKGPFSVIRWSASFRIKIIFF
jgi:hypothetical protein